MTENTKQLIEEALKRFDEMEDYIADVEMTRQEYVNEHKAFLREELETIASKSAEEKDKKLSELVQLLESYLDDDECSFDHHGYCQTHFGGSEPGKCRNTVAKEVVSSLSQPKDL